MDQPAISLYSPAQLNAVQGVELFVIVVVADNAERLRFLSDGQLASEGEDFEASQRMNVDEVLDCCGRI